MPTREGQSSYQAIVSGSLVVSLHAPRERNLCPVSLGFFLDLKPILHGYRPLTKNPFPLSLVESVGPFSFPQLEFNPCLLAQHTAADFTLFCRGFS